MRARNWRRAARKRSRKGDLAYRDYFQARAAYRARFVRLDFDAYAMDLAIRVRQDLIGMFSTLGD